MNPIFPVGSNFMSIRFSQSSRNADLVLHGFHFARGSQSHSNGALSFDITIGGRSLKLTIILRRSLAHLGKQLLWFACDAHGKANPEWTVSSWRVLARDFLAENIVVTWCSQAWSSERFEEVNNREIFCGGLVHWTRTEVSYHHRPLL